MKIGCRTLICISLAGCLSGVVPILAFQQNNQQVLRDAEGYLNNKQLENAKQKAEQIKDAPGVGSRASQILELIEDIKENNQKKTDARLAIGRKNFEDACDYLNEIKAAIEANKELRKYVDIGSMYSQAKCSSFIPPAPEPSGAQAVPATNKQQPPLKPPEPVDTLKPDYDRAVSLMNGGDFEGALGIFKRIQSAQSDYKDVSASIKRCSQEIDRIKKMGKDAQFADLADKANKLVAKGDLRSAMSSLKQMEALRPDDPSLKSFRQKITEARETDHRELEKAITAFYSGNYDQAYKAFADFDARPHSAAVSSFARFYAGAALGSKYYLSGEKDEKAKTDAIQMFQLAAKGEFSYSPKWDFLSPKIKLLYSQAINK